MTGVCLYVLMPRAVAPPGDLRGVKGEPLALSEAAGLHVWHSQLERAPLPSVEAVRRHDAVARVAMASGDTPLPLRFGQWLPSWEEAERRLAERATQYGEALRRVSGCAEHGLRIGLREEDRAVPPEPAGGPGTRHLRERAGARAGTAPGEGAGAAVLRALDEELEGLVRDSDSRLDARGLIQVAHLVPRAGEEEYRERVRVVRTRFPALRFLVSGPWPPYTFSQ